jgi:hypothetical protein
MPFFQGTKVKLTLYFFSMQWKKKIPAKISAGEVKKAYYKANHRCYESTPVITEGDKGGLKGFLLFEQIDVF